MTTDLLACSRNHRLTRWEPFSCDAGHDHRVYSCWMRLGSRRCGEVVTVPPLSPTCTEKESR